LKQFIFVADAFISPVDTQAMNIKSIIPNTIAMCSLKPEILAGFEPGSSVPEADAMSMPQGQVL
jgi:hypothetical protein